MSPVSSLSIFTVVLLSLMVAHTQKVPPPYIHTCHWRDPNVTSCFVEAMHHIRPYLANGIPDIELPRTEPFILDQLSLALTTGPNGYRVTLKDLELFGATNYTVTKFRLGDNPNAPFDLHIKIPSLRISSAYTSSGVLIIIPASGAGSFHATLGGVACSIKGAASSHERGKEKYLNVDKMNVDLKIKDVNMGIKRAFNNNPILTEATNLFLRTNGHEVLDAMMPQLRQRMADVFLGIANTILKHVPVSYLVTD